MVSVRQFHDPRFDIFSHKQHNRDNFLISRLPQKHDKIHHRIEFDEIAVDFVTSAPMENQHESLFFASKLSSRKSLFVQAQEAEGKSENFFLVLGVFIEALPKWPRLSRGAGCVHE